MKYGDLPIKNWDFTMKKLDLQEKVGLTVKNEALSVGNWDFI